MTSRKETDLEKMELDFDALDSVSGGLVPPTQLGSIIIVKEEDLFHTIEEFEPYFNKQVNVYKKMLNAEDSNQYFKYREGKVIEINKQMSLATIECVDCKIIVNPLYDKNTAVGPKK